MLNFGSKKGVAIAWAPGSCGELVQGVVDGVYFLISCPVAMYSRVTVRLSADPAHYSGSPADDGGARVDGYTKSYRALMMSMAACSSTRKIAQWQIDTDLPQGKGMASSTADITATVAAAFAAAGRPVPLPPDLARLAVSIEPSDGIMFPGLVIFNHQQGRLLQWLGSPPPMRVMVFDYGGSVDTLAFNSSSRLHDLNRAKEKQVKLARDLVVAGVKSGDPGLIGRGATISALANQDILPKPGLAEVVELATRVLGAVGVCAAHSGTVIGIIFPPWARVDAHAAEGVLQEVVPWLQLLKTTDLIGGGVWLS